MPAVRCCMTSLWRIHGIHLVYGLNLNIREPERLIMMTYFISHLQYTDYCFG